MNYMTKKQTSPFTIAPKDRRILKSSKVREYYKLINSILEPKKQEIIDAADKSFADAMIYGIGWLKYEYKDK